MTTAAARPRETRSSEKSGVRKREPRNRDSIVTRLDLEKSALQLGSTRDRSWLGSRDADTGLVGRLLTNTGNQNYCRHGCKPFRVRL